MSRKQKKIQKSFAVLIIFCLFIFFASIAASVQADGVTWPSVGLPSSSDGIKGVVENFMKWILSIFSALAIISFVITGIMYFMLAGNDREVEKAKNQMTWSIIGVIVGLSGLVIINAIQTWIGGSSTF